MKFKVKKISLAVICLAAYTFIACSSALPMPTMRHATWASARWEGTDSTALFRGRDLYVLKCSGCHSLFDPTQFSEEKWRKEMLVMRKKAKISTTDGETILRYIITAAATPTE